MKVLNLSQVDRVVGGLATKSTLCAIVAGYLTAGPAGAGLIVSNMIILQGINKLTILIETGRIT